MSLGLKQKRLVVDELAKMASNSTSVIAADYKGLKSSEMTQLRANMRKLNDNIRVRVVRNTLAKLAFNGTNYEEITKKLVGPVILVFTNDEVSSVARLLKDFIKEKEKLTVTALIVEGKLLNGSQLELVATLPTKQESIAQLIAVIQAPIAKFVRTVAAPYGKLVRTVMAVCNKK